MPQTLTLVVPCYNEAARLDRAELLRLVRAREGFAVLFVDDGSKDATAAVLDELRRAEPFRISVVRLPRNGGKAEAVRAGLRAAMADGAPMVGYADADLSTPVDELLRLVDTALGSSRDAVLASRVRLLGRRIERRTHRHYLGRVFATLASFALGLPVYDTQCGAKLFRATPALAAALASPFRTRWIFDVELLARLRAGGPGAPALGQDAFEEVPLRAWRDVGGSKLRPGAMLVAGLQLLALAVRMRLSPGARR